MARREKAPPRPRAPRTPPEAAEAPAAAAPEGLSREEVAAARDLVNLGRALGGSLTSAQVSRLAAAAGELLPLVDALQAPGVRRLAEALAESAGDLAEVVRLVASYHRAGQIQRGLELLTVVSVLQGALGTPAVGRLAETAGAVLVAADRLAAEVGGVEALDRAGRAAGSARRQAAADTPALGALGLLRELRDPAVQRGVKYGLAFLKALGRR